MNGAWLSENGRGKVRGKNQKVPSLTTGCQWPFIRPFRFHGLVFNVRAAEHFVHSIGAPSVRWSSLVVYMGPDIQDSIWRCSSRPCGDRPTTCSTSIIISSMIVRLFWTYASWNIKMRSRQSRDETGFGTRTDRLLHVICNRYHSGHLGVLFRWYLLTINQPRIYMTERCPWTFPFWIIFSCCTKGMQLSFLSTPGAFSNGDILAWLSSGHGYHHSFILPTCTSIKSPSVNMGGFRFGNI